MATKREKQLATILLKERLERLTGKKVVFKESAQRDIVPHGPEGGYQAAGNYIARILLDIEDSTDALNNGETAIFMIKYNTNPVSEDEISWEISWEVTDDFER